ncbi:MAG: cysteine hydrolase, partial [Methanomassiliicoccales archaeon]|nr:cysteine hydrolase [Methanomassiliicoccales archaeon]
MNNARHACILTIDLHRGHLDPSVATLPLQPERARRVTDACRLITGRARELHIPVIHVVTEYNSSLESLSNPFWKRIENDSGNRRSGMGNHNIVGSPGTNLMNEVHSSGDIIIRGKKRYDSFLATQLDFTLKSLDVGIIGIVGVNTNSCVLATAIEASVRDYDVVVLEEGVETMDDSSLHTAALRIVETSFGRVMKAGDFFNLPEVCGQ